MRLRYWLILAVFVGGALSGRALDTRIQLLRTLPQVVADPAAVAALELSPMPAQASEIGDGLGRLAELRQDELLVAIRDYQASQRLAEALGIDQERIATLGEARRWKQADPAQVTKLAQRLLREGVEAALAPAEMPPPRLGRSGNLYNAMFVPVGDGLWQVQASDEAPPMYVFVIELHNTSRLPLLNARFAVLPRGGASLPADVALPAGSYLWCDVDGSFAQSPPLPPRDATQVTCEVRAGGANPPPRETLQQLMRALRARPIEPWVRSLELTLADSQRMGSLQVEDTGVDAANGHGHTDRVTAGLLARTVPSVGPPRPTRMLTRCEERGDCQRERLVPFQGLVSNVWITLALLIPGYLVAGLSRATRSGTHWMGVAAFIVVAAIVIPLTLHAAGGGYGPLAALLILGYGAITWWIGYVLGRWASRAT